MPCFLYCLGLSLILLRSAALAEEFDTSTLHGVVKNAQGDPVAGVRVWINRTSNARMAPGLKTEGVTDDQGKYEIPLRYEQGKSLSVREVFADKAGFVRGISGDAIQVRAGDKTRQDYQLQPGEILAGELRLPLLPSERGRDPASVRRILAVFGPNVDKLPLNARCFIPDARGKFEIYLPEGEYSLRVLGYGSGPIELTKLRPPRRDLRIEMAPFVWDAESVGKAFDDFCDAFDRNYSYFYRKPDVDWTALRTEHRAAARQAKNPAELAAALKPMLTPFGDMHIWIETPTGVIGTRDGGYSFNGNRDVTLAEIEDRVECGKFAIVGKTKRDGFGYFLMRRQSESNAENVRQAIDAIRKLKDAPGFVVDLRSANGGSEPLALEIASLFCTKPTVYAKSKYRSGPKHDDFGQVFERILPATAGAYSGPVVCLIGPGAVSSGEGFVQMMKCLPNVTTVGLPTRGASGNPKPHALGGSGVSVYFSTWVGMLPDGQAIEGVGVTPDVQVTARKLDYAAADPTLERSLEILRAAIAAP